MANARAPLVVGFAVVTGPAVAGVAVDEVAGRTTEVLLLRLLAAVELVACCPPLGCRPTLPALAILRGRADPKLLASTEVDKDSPPDSSAIGVTWPAC